MIRALCLSLALLCPVATMAGPVSVSGRVAASATDLNEGTGIAAIDVTFALPITTRLSAELGTYLFALEGKRPHETYVGLALDNRWRFGAVRPAYDSVLPSVFERVAPYLAYRRAEYTRAHATTEAMRNTAVPSGLSWQQRFGQTSWAVSLHDAAKGGFRSISAAYTLHGTGWQLAAAAEPVWLRDGSYLGTNAKLGLRAELGSGEVGVAILHPDANNRPDALAGDLAYPLNSRLDLRTFGELTRGRTDDAYGLALDHAIHGNSNVILALTDGAAGRAIHLTLERRF